MDAVRRNRLDDVAAPAGVPLNPAYPTGYEKLTPQAERFRQRGWMFVVVWWFYLIPVIEAAWHQENVFRRVGGVVLVVAFAVVYVRGFYLARGRRWSGAAAPIGRPHAWAVLGLAAGLTVATCVVVGQEGTALTVFLGVMLVLLLDMPPAGVLVVALIGITWLAGRFVPGWDNDNDVIFSIFLGSLAVWGITQMIARNRQLALANDEIRQLAIAGERTRFSRDLHDLLGHSLTVITVKTELAGRLLDIDPSRAAVEIADVERLARDALADVRAAVAGYREVSLAGELSSARTALEAAGITGEIPTAVDDVPGDRRELFGWAVREGVTNVIRHSGASRCRITVDGRAVEIVDDGLGPARPPAEPGDPAPPGNGLQGLRERADDVGATVTVGRAPGGNGFRLRVGW